MKACTTIGSKPILLSDISEREKLTIAKGLCDYRYIMDQWRSDSDDFRKVYYDFYLKARWAVMSKERDKKLYFEKMRSLKPGEELKTVVGYLKNNISSQTYEFSLISKMFHTRNDELPIYDSKVKNYLSKAEGVQFCWYGKGTKDEMSELERIDTDWKSLKNWYKTFLSTPRGQEWVDWFDENFPQYKGISPVKKVDFIIFATQP